MQITVILCRGLSEAVLSLHDSGNLDNGGQPEVYDISFIIKVIQCEIIILGIIVIVKISYHSSD